MATVLYATKFACRFFGLVNISFKWNMLKLTVLQEDELAESVGDRNATKTAAVSTRPNSPEKKKEK